MMEIAGWISAAIMLGFVAGVAVTITWANGKSE